jgi:hypothetical protein
VGPLYFLLGAFRIVDDYDNDNDENLRDECKRVAMLFDCNGLLIAINFV